MSALTAIYFSHASCLHVTTRDVSDLTEDYDAMFIISLIIFQTPLPCCFSRHSRQSWQDINMAMTQIWKKQTLSQSMKPHLHKESMRKRKTRDNFISKASMIISWNCPALTQEMRSPVPRSTGLSLTAGSDAPVSPNCAVLDWRRVHQAAREESSMFCISPPSSRCTPRCRLFWHRSLIKRVLSAATLSLKAELGELSWTNHGR